ncbi:hypothetical protein [Pseudarthrobacter sp. ATCC 49987]|uniref:hypothetical protein n=1 Tax=Pseudarthrobacter sp. ATCC 49987 TaxID=2698204 RepID=UPI00137063E0|nr:hypothetical protein [Pseudarthrobacter sp. ATCC 49987]
MSKLRENLKRALKLKRLPASLKNNTFITASPYITDAQLDAVLDAVMEAIPEAVTDELELFSVQGFNSALYEVRRVLSEAKAGDRE